jgi:tol-pal system protein YbgF
VIVWAIMLSIAGWLASYFEPRFLFSRTVTTGGDTASHYHTAVYLKEVLLPNGQIVGWMPGNYAGFPVLLFYFPLPFLVIAAAGSVIPLEVAFKLVTVLGTFLLPLAAYGALKGLKYEFPTPIVGAAFTLPFLFMEANSMWGGNILSTLAGEFAFSLGFAVSILFVGTLYDGLMSRKHVVRNAALIAVIGFSHGYALLFAGLVSLFFLVTTERFLEKLAYLVKVHGLGFCLMGFWIVPLLANLPYNTRYNFIWTIHSISEVFPLILLPWVALAMALGAAGVASAARSRGLSRAAVQGMWESFDTRRAYLWFGVLTSLVFYWVAFRIHLVDIRFLPYLQIFLCLIAAVELGTMTSSWRLRWLAPIFISSVVFLWVGYHETNVKNWIAWNYSGFEAKPAWPAFAEINRHLSGDAADPRVVYEHSSIHNQAGTPRAFESIPLFSGRSTLEGIYMQSSLSSPFVFYIQSEISKEISCPLPDYGCSTLNVANARRHLEMFNVRDVIVISPEAKSEFRKTPEFRLARTVGDYDIYELTSNRNRYVTPLEYEPVLYETDDWKTASYRWFKNPQANDVHLVFPDGRARGEGRAFRAVYHGEDMDRLPRVPVDGQCDVGEQVAEQEVVIQTTCVGKPLLVKISYHPKWRVEGAERIFLASPSFMVVYPERERVRLTFAENRADYAGMGLTILGVGLIGLAVPPLRGNRVSMALQAAARREAASLRASVNIGRIVPGLGEALARRKVPVVISAWTLVGGLFVGFVAAAKSEDPAILYADALGWFEQGHYDASRELFARVITAYPETASASNASYFNAVTYFKQGAYPQAAEAFRQLTQRYPESHWVPEAYYHLALCADALDGPEQGRRAYETVIAKFPATRWAEYARARLAERPGAPPRGGSEAGDRYAEAMALFDNGAYPEARAAFQRVVEMDPSARMGEVAAYFVAVSWFKEARFRETIDEFERFINAYPGSEYLPEAFYHIAMSHAFVHEPEKARTAFEGVIRDFPSSRWADYSKERLRESAAAQSELG